MLIKNTSIIFLIFISSFLGLNTSEIGIERRIEKRVQKLFDQKNCSIKPIAELPDVFHKPVGEIYHQYEIIANQEILGYVLHGMTHVCYFGGCSAFTDKSKNVNREEVKFILYFNVNQEIKFIEIIGFESNYGYEISARWWLKQFYNKRPGSFEIGEDIDGITGATVSCEQFVNNLNQLVSQE